LLFFALAAPSPAAVNGFEGGDGDQVCGAGLDWACLPASVAVASATDPTGGGDDVFSGGKETDPGDWTFATGGTGDKTDIGAVWSAAVETPSNAYLYLAFSRAKGEGNAFFSFELNQLHTSWTNAHGATVPCRTDGDVLVSYEIPSTTVDPVGIKLYRWNGSGGPATCPDGSTGAWLAGGGAASIREGDINDGAIANGLPGAPASLGDATFGEAAIDLDGVVTEVGIARPCEYFTRLQAHSRSSVSLSSNLGDYVDGGAIKVAACKNPGPGPDVTAPAAPQLSAAADCNSAQVKFTGKAEAGSQVQITEGGEFRAFADADPVTGDFSYTLSGVADGTHVYKARARDDAANTSDESAAAEATVDATAPAAPVISTPAAGASVAAGQVTLKGTAQAGATVTVTEGGTVLGAVTAAADGGWSFVVTAAAGQHAYEVTAADACAASAAAKLAIVAGTPGDGDGSGGSGGNGGNGGNAAGGGGGTTLAPASPSKPADRGEVLPAVASCEVKPFTLYLPAAGIKRVSFRVDGRQVVLAKKADAQGRFAFRIDPRRFKAGKHTTSAKLTLVKGKPVVVPMRTFSACTVGKCVSRRAFPIRVRKVSGDRVVSAKVYVNKKRVKVVRGSRLRAAVKLAGLPKGKFTVRIVSRLASGKTSVDERTYRTCTPKKKKG
jgi:hypothetical protein